MRTLYLDCFSGISGDMTIAALLDLGIPQKLLDAELKKLGISDEFHIHVARRKKQQVMGLKFDVHAFYPEAAKHRLRGNGHGHGNGNGNGNGHHHHDHGNGHGHSHHEHHHDEEAAHGHSGHEHQHTHGRSFSDIRKLIEKSKLSSFVKDSAVSIFHRIAVVEGKIHGTPTEKVHFHEVGAIDSIIDIVGVCILIEELGVDQILASPPSEGHGFVECEHGRFPVPTTATLELLRGIPLRQIDLEGELITPTGAAILAEFVDKFCTMPAMVVQKIGYGLGTRDYPDHPNLLRAILCDASPIEKISSESAVDVIETNVDDISPEILAAASDALFKKGARDVYFSPIQMKKGRPGTLITLLCDPELTNELADLLFRETGTFGARVRRSERICLGREIRKVKTVHGMIEVKVGSREGQIITAKPELEVCRKIAEKKKISLKRVWMAALAECAKLIEKQEI